MITLREIKLAIATEVYTDEIKEVLSIFDDCVIYHSIITDKYYIVKDKIAIIIMWNHTSITDIICEFLDSDFTKYFNINDMNECIKFILAQCLNLNFDYILVSRTNIGFFITGEVENKILTINKEEFIKKIKNIY